MRAFVINAVLVLWRRILSRCAHFAAAVRQAHGAIALAGACRSPAYGSLARVRMMPTVLTVGNVRPGASASSR